MDGGAWWATVHGVAKSQTQLSNLTSLLTSLLRSECGAMVAADVSGKWNRMGGRDCKEYEEDLGHDEYAEYCMLFSLINARNGGYPFHQHVATAIADVQPTIHRTPVVHADKLFH